jgi:PPK2 family polyphosphate:nucleotide phosphotransferase
VTKASAQERLVGQARKLSDLQYLLYAENRRSLLICLQGLDAAGKDGTIRHVLSSMNPAGVRAHAFKVPSALEATHDFLWRVHREAPATGEIVIFNRSHYEDVLVPRVHGTVPKRVWLRRYELINEFEKNLVEGGSHILKFFLHMSSDEQLRRFERRLEDPMRRWKITEADYAERKRWPEYIKAYEQVLERTSTEPAPCFIIPADRKWFRNFAISRILVTTLESLGMKAPQPTVDLNRIRREYHSAVHSRKRLSEP